MEDENFNNELEDLLNMLKKLMEKQDLSSIPGVDPQQLEQLKMFMSQFDELKDDMKIEIYKLDPFTKQIVTVKGTINRISKHRHPNDRRNGYE